MCEFVGLLIGQVGTASDCHLVQIPDRDELDLFVRFEVLTAASMKMTAL
jgi:hypothetical protein